MIKDSSARSPYGVKVWYPNGSGAISTVKGIVGDVCYFNEDPAHGNFCRIEAVKPYLRPLSSMTEEEENELTSIAVLGGYNGSVFNSFVVVDWLNKNKFDYRGLIPMDLALEALKGMYKTE